MMPQDNVQYNAGDEVAENNVRKDEARARRNDADVLRGIMRTKAGRDWLYRQLECCHIFDNPAVPGDTHATYMNLGEQNYGKQLWLAAQNASIDLYMKMMAEQNEEQNRREAVMRELNERSLRPDRPLTPDDQLPFIPPPQEAPAASDDRKSKKKDSK